MAIDQVNVGTPTNIFEFTDSAMGASVDGIKSSSAVLYSVTVDNSGNLFAASYVKLFNATSGSVVSGVTPPDEIIYVPGGAVVTRTYSTGAFAGVTFGTALSAICVTVGGTTGIIPPINTVAVLVNYT
jgi:hypothetical protein